MHMSIKKISGKCVKIISMMSLAIICVVLNAMLAIRVPPVSVALD